MRFYLLDDNGEQLFPYIDPSASLSKVTMLELSDSLHGYVGRFTGGVLMGIYLPIEIYTGKQPYKNGSYAIYNKKKERWLGRNGTLHGNIFIHGWPSLTNGTLTYIMSCTWVEIPSFLLDDTTICMYKMPTLIDTLQEDLRLQARALYRIFGNKCPDTVYPLLKYTATELDRLSTAGISVP